MKAIRPRARTIRDGNGNGNGNGNEATGSDAGLTLIEILVAMMVFAIIAIGVAYALTSTLTMTGDARSREVAANLAAQEIDLSRSVEKVFTLVDGDKTFDLNGTTFNLHRATNWVTSAGTDTTCGSGVGQLLYKRVNVSVTWEGMRATAPAVRADTVIAPGAKINDPALGTILVSVLTASGGGSEGVTVTASPSSVPNGAVTIPESPAPTDAQGCSYILKVKPGTYDVTISRPGFIDIDQSATSRASVPVTAGAAASVAFRYDGASTINVNYASNDPSASILIPTNLDTTFRSTYGVYTSTATSDARSRTLDLHPVTGGYTVFAGKYAAGSDSSTSCLSVDAAAWTTPAADGAVGHTPEAVETVPGGTTSADVAMGVLTVKGLSGKYLKVVSETAAAGTGDPGCALVMTYTFSKLPTSPAHIALPFGSWRLYSGDSASTRETPVPPASMAVETRGGPVPASGIVTLDPRVVNP